MSSTQTAVVTLPSDDQILIEREFAAPAALVYRAWTEPELVKRWWGANRGEVVGAEVDLRVGGRWRWTSRLPDGSEFAFYGEYRELVPGERIVTTEVFEPYPDAAAVNTLTLTERDGRTTMRLLVQHATKEHRDAHVNSGMEAGMQDAMDLLEQAVVALARD